jgi:hypothetical protein
MGKVLSAVVVSLAVACGGDVAETGPTGGTGGTAAGGGNGASGSAPAATGGSGAAGGTGGSGANGGSGGNAGSGASSVGGSAGAREPDSCLGALPDAPAECSSCLCTQCDRWMEECIADSVCTEILRCVERTQCWGRCLEVCEVINENGGPMGPAGNLASNVFACSEGVCRCFGAP